MHASSFMGTSSHFPRPECLCQGTVTEPLWHVAVWQKPVSRESTFFPILTGHVLGYC